MKKSITISIPEPCHENWLEMTPTEKGKFCDVCTKEVIDFTQTTDEELLKKVSSDASLCGRFKKSQLDREIKLERKSSNSFVNYAASLLMPLSLLSTSISSAETDANYKKPYTSIGIGSLNKARAVVTGKVTDINRTPLHNTQIRIKGTDKIFEVENDGSFHLKCISDDVLVFSADGYINQEFNVGRNKQLNLPVILNSEKIEVAPVIFTYTPLEKSVMTLGRPNVSESQELKTATYNKKEELDLKEDLKLTEEKQVRVNSITISGTITDEYNLPLLGVNVIEKGTTNGTQTDFNGNYAITVNRNQTLQFYYLSYETKEILVSNISNSISLQLEPALEGMIIIVDYRHDKLAPSNPSPFYNSEENVARRKQAYKNTIAYEKVKAERKKEARKKARLAKRKK